MAEIWVTIPADRWLHARPAASLVRTVVRFRSRITIENPASDRGPVDARSLISLLSLGATGGTTLRITAVGDDAAEALAALEHELHSLLDAETHV